MKKCFQDRLRIMFLCSILNFANNCCWVPLALQTIINSKEFDAAVCKYKFSILLVILHFFQVCLLRRTFKTFQKWADPTPGLASFIISEQGLLKQLSSSNPNKACGPDQIPPWFLKTFAADIAPILTDIFQDSIDSGTAPHRWKEADVCAVFKKGKKSDPAKTYISCVAKILEHIVHSFIMKHLNKHNILTDCQHGFRAKRSTDAANSHLTRHGTGYSQLIYPRGRFGLCQSF